MLRKMEKKLQEEDERKKKLLDKKRIQKIKQKNLPKAIEQQNKANMQLLQFKPIELPEPGVKDNELLSIGKMAAADRKVPGMGLQDNPTEILAGDYSSQRHLLYSSKRQTPLISERIMRGAQDAFYLKQTQTPLVLPTAILQNGTELAQTPALGKRMANETELADKIKRQKIETPLRDYIGVSKTRDSEWEPKAKQLSLKKALQSLPQPKVVSYKVSIEQIQALQNSIEAADQEIINTNQEENDL